MTARGLSTIVAIPQGYVRTVSKENFLDPEVLITLVRSKERKERCLLLTRQVLYAMPKMQSFHFYPILRWSFVYSK